MKWDKTLKQTDRWIISLKKVDVFTAVATRLGPAMKTMRLALTQMGLDIPNALGVIGKIRTVLLSRCPIAVLQHV